MKYLTSIPRAALSRAALLFCTALILSATVGCGKSPASWNPFASEEPGWKDRTDYLESKIDRIHQMVRQRDQSRRADFWQITSVVLILLVFFALVGGAALGSRARRDCLAGDDSSQGKEALTQSSK